MRPADPNKGVWPTPDWLYQPLAQRLAFDLDAAATAANAKCRSYLTQAEDGLSRPWPARHAWCNPPYGQQPGTDAWVAHARFQVESGTCGAATLLVPVKAETAWWQDTVCGQWRVLASRKVLTGPLQGLWLRLQEPDWCTELLYLRRRVSFGGGAGFFASALVTFNAPKGALIFDGEPRGGRRRSVPARPKSETLAQLGQPGVDRRTQVEQVAALISGGLSVLDACARVGLSARTWYRHRQGVIESTEGRDQRTQVDAVAELIADGVPAREACARVGLSKSTWYRLRGGAHESR